MEDEHVCIDNLVDHLGQTTDCPSPGAFYGVGMSIHLACSSLGDACNFDNASIT